MMPLVTEMILHIDGKIFEPIVGPISYLIPYCTGYKQENMGGLESIRTVISNSFSADVVYHKFIALYITFFSEC